MKYLYLHDVECYFEILSVLKDLLIQHVNNIWIFSSYSIK